MVKAASNPGRWADEIRKQAINLKIMDRHIVTAIMTTAQ
jgi:hypothetical protein